MKATNANGRSSSRRLAARSVESGPIAVEQILSADDLTMEVPPQPVYIPELSREGVKKYLYLRQLSAGEVLAFTEDSKDALPFESNDALLVLIAQALVTPDNKLLFPDAAVASSDEQARKRLIAVLRAKIPMPVFNRLSSLVVKLTTADGSAEGEG